MLLDVRDLVIEFESLRGKLRAVDSVSFSLDQGDSLGLVGESGCGKSTTGYGLMRLLAPNGRIAGGQVLLNGVDLLPMPEDELRRLRWAKMAIVFQNAMSALNPVLRISDQIVSALLLHVPMSKTEALRRAAAAFERVNLPASRLNQYPHEFSGGMKQRAMIAMALICEPQILIADEPTTALDVVAQQQVLQLLGDLKQQMNLSLILISHDISAVAETCARVAVMYAGKIAEIGAASEVFHRFRHPYTRALITSLPSLHAPIRALTSLPGTPPDLISPPSGCRFAPRCPYVQSLCTEEDPPYVQVSPQHWARCHYAQQLDLAVSEREGRHATG